MQGWGKFLKNKNFFKVFVQDLEAGWYILGIKQNTVS